MYICQVDDTVGKEHQEPTMEEMTIAAGLNPEEDIWQLHTRIEIVVGMKAMVTMNISTEADIANGTGEIFSWTTENNWFSQKFKKGLSLSCTHW